MEKIIQSILRQKARELNLSQQVMAQELGVSLATMKRWMKGDGLNLSNLKQLCDLLGLSLAELFHAVDGTGTPSFTYSFEQEKFLAADPKLLAFYDLLVSGKSVASIKKTYELPDSSLTGLVLKLERIGLVEQRGPRVKLLREGEPQWLVDGPLSQKYRLQMIERFLGDHPKAKTNFTIHDYLPQDLAIIKGKIEELKQYMLLANKRAASQPGEAVSYGAYVTLKEYEWSVRDSLKERR